MTNQVEPRQKSSQVDGTFIGRELSWPHNDEVTLRVNHEPVIFKFAAELAIRYIHSFELDFLPHVELENNKDVRQQVVASGAYRDGLTIKRGKLKVAPVGRDVDRQLSFLVSTDIKAFGRNERFINLRKDQERFSCQLFGEDYEVPIRAGSLALGVLLTPSFGRALTAAHMLDRQMSVETKAGPIELLPPVHLPKPR